MPNPWQMGKILSPNQLIREISTLQSEIVVGNPSRVLIAAKLRGLADGLEVTNNRQAAQRKPDAPKPDVGPDADLFRDLVIKAIKKVGDGVRALGLGSIVKFSPQKKIDTDRYGGIHAYFYLEMEHEKITWRHRPGISFYWDTSKNEGSVGTLQLVSQNKHYDNLPLTKMGPAMLEAAEDILNDLKKQIAKPGSDEEAWSVVTLDRDGYATEVEVFGAKAKAESEARDRGNCYVVKGTQMWNEPLGQVEEHDRTAPFKSFR